MRRIDLIVIHCTATRANKDFTLEALRRCHVVENHWSDIGYHFYIRKDGTIYPCRPPSKVGAHAKGYNAHSLGVCYEGGLDAKGQPADTRTTWQKASLIELLKKLKLLYPDAKIVGHYELGAKKACPCFCASQEYSKL